MKKIFFSALVAVAAIGGGITSANAQYLSGGSQQIPCSNTLGVDCAIALSLPAETPVYASPAPDQGPQIGTLADYTYTGE